MNDLTEMKKLMERLETINEGIQERVVHAQSTRALAEDIVMHAKSIADKNGIVITSDKGFQVWEGMLTKHLRDSMKSLEDYVLQKRIDIESLAGQDGRARDMQDEGINEARREDPLRSDPNNPPTPYDTDKALDRIRGRTEPETYSAGMVEIKIDNDEVTISNGHGQNIFLTREEFADMVDVIRGQGLGYL